jgi:hypothetical protein
MEVALLQNKLKDVFLTFYVHFLQKQGYKVQIEDIEEGKQRGGEKPFIQFMLEALLDAILLTIVIIIGIMKGNMKGNMTYIDEYIEQIKQDPAKTIREIEPADLTDARKLIHKSLIISKKLPRIENNEDVNSVVKETFKGNLQDMVHNLGKLGAAITKTQENELNDRPTHVLLQPNQRRKRSMSTQIENAANFNFQDVYDEQKNNNENEENPLNKGKKADMVSSDYNDQMVGMDSRAVKDNVNIGGSRKRRGGSRKRRGGSRKRRGGSDKRVQKRKSMRR